MTGIEIKDLSLSFSLKEVRLQVLKGLNLFIPDNQITVLLGKSGCGKTSLLRVIQGLEKTYTGQVVLNEKRCTTVFQEPRLFPWLTVEKNLMFASKLSSDRLEELLHFVGLVQFRQALPRQLSGGMQSRVAIARALASEADFILMDEPFAALDEFTRETLQKELRELQIKKNLGILFVTHSIDEALRIADKIVVMSDGKIRDRYTILEEKRDLLSEEFIQYKCKILASLRR